MEPDVLQDIANILAPLNKNLGDMRGHIKTQEGKPMLDLQSHFQEQKTKLIEDFWEVNKNVKTDEGRIFLCRISNYVEQFYNIAKLQTDITFQGDIKKSAVVSAKEQLEVLTIMFGSFNSPDKAVKRLEEWHEREMRFGEKEGLEKDCKPELHSENKMTPNNRNIPNVLGAPEGKFHT